MAENEHTASFKRTPEAEHENAINNFEFNLSLLIHSVKKYAP